MTDRLDPSPMQDLAAPPASLPQKPAIFLRIRLPQIRVSPYQARKDITDSSVSGLAKSMNLEGQLQAILVRVAPGATLDIPPASGIEIPLAPADLAFELINGERRWRAAQLLQWETIEAKVIQTVSEGEAAAKGIVENLQREDINPIDEASGLLNLSRLDPGYWTQEKIGEVTGKSQTQISQTLRLLDLPEKIKENIRRRIISMKHAAELFRLQTPELQLNVSEQIITNKLSSDGLRTLVNKLLKHKNDPVKKSGKQSLDPLADLWGDLLLHPDIKAGSWEVNFKKGKWIFAVDSKALPNKADLAEWFHQMGDALGGSAGGAQSIIEKVDQVSDPTPAPSPSALVASRAQVPVPQIKQASYVEGNKMKILWQDIGPGFTYRLFRTNGYSDAFHPSVEDKTIATPGAVVNAFAGDTKEIMLAVMAIDPQGHESELSQPIKFELKPWNDTDQVEPLA